MNNPSDEKYLLLTSNQALTEQQQIEIAALNAMPDETIDFSDIPPLTESFWQNATRNPLYKPKKTKASIRIDSDILL